MTSKIITYDLCKPGANYRSLIDKIKTYDKWAKITESTWFIKSELTCKEVRDELKMLVDANDRLFVGELTGTAAWYNILCKNEYLKDNL